MVEQLYRAIALNYGIQSILANANVNFYNIINGEAILEQEDILNPQLHAIVIANTDSSVFAFYVDSLHFKNPEENLTFALAIRENLLPGALGYKALFTEMIALHELAHLIEQQNLVDQLGIILNDCDRTIGRLIEQRAARIEQDLTHNNEFGAILHHLIQRQNPTNSQRSLRLAMSQTLLDIEQAILDGEIDENFYQC